MWSSCRSLDHNYKQQTEADFFVSHLMIDSPRSLPPPTRGEGVLDYSLNGTSNFLAIILGISININLVNLVHVKH